MSETESMLAELLALDPVDADIIRWMNLTRFHMQFLFGNDGAVSFVNVMDYLYEYHRTRNVVAAVRPRMEKLERAGLVEHYLWGSVDSYTDRWILSDSIMVQTRDREDVLPAQAEGDIYCDCCGVKLWKLHFPKDLPKPYWFSVRTNRAWCIRCFLVVKLCGI